VICVLPDFNIPFSKPDCNPPFLFVAALCDRRSNFTGQMILPWAGMLPRQTHLRVTFGAFGRTFETVEAHEKNLSRFP
jgi:hypothetical protein